MTVSEKIKELIEQVDKAMPLAEIVEAMPASSKLVEQTLKQYRNIIITATASIMIDRGGKL
jgi:hypothetical protein